MYVSNGEEPGKGDALRKAETARFARAMGTLVAASVPLVQSIGIAAARGLKEEDVARLYFFVGQQLGELVHRRLECEVGLRPSRCTVGVGRSLVGRDLVARELEVGDAIGAA